MLALHRWTGHPEDAEAGTIVEGAVEQRAGSLRELEELANPGLVDSFDYEEAIRDRSQGWDGLSPMTLNADERIASSLQDLEELAEG